MEATNETAKGEDYINTKNTYTLVWNGRRTGVLIVLLRGVASRWSQPRQLGTTNGPNTGRR